MLIIVQIDFNVMSYAHACIGINVSATVASKHNISTFVAFDLHKKCIYSFIGIHIILIYIDTRMSSQLVLTHNEGRQYYDRCICLCLICLSAGVFVCLYVYM